MVYDLKELFQEEILAQADELDQLEIDQEDVVEVLNENVDIHDPNQRLDRIGGTSLHDAKRKEPISVNVDIRDILRGSGTVIAGVAITNPYYSGAVLLLFITTILMKRKHEITPYQALTYGVGWNLVGDKNTVIEKEYLIDEVIEASKDVDVVEDMTREEVESTLGELKTMKCINVQEADKEALVWFREEFDVNILPDSLAYEDSES